MKTSIASRSRLPIGLLAIACSAVGTMAVEPKASPFEAEIRKFEEQDAKSPPPAGAVLFVGSSSIRLWDLKKSFPDLVTINRGFGGSQISDSVAFAKRIVTPYKPRAIVFYAGDNDIASGKSPEQVAADFKAFVDLVRAELPKTPIYFIGIKPSINRWSQLSKQRAANQLIHDFCKSQSKLHFLNVEPLMLDESGQARKELLAADGLHMTAAGYAAWSTLVDAALTASK